MEKTLCVYHVFDMQGSPLQKIYIGTAFTLEEAQEMLLDEYADVASEDGIARKDMLKWIHTQYLSYERPFIMPYIIKGSDK